MRLTPFGKLLLVAPCMLIFLVVMYLADFKNGPSSDAGLWLWFISML